MAFSINASWASVTFSFLPDQAFNADCCRALQYSALNTWAGKKENAIDAQEVFIEKAKANSLATVAGL